MKITTDIKKSLNLLLRRVWGTLSAEHDFRKIVPLKKITLAVGNHFNMPTVEQKRMHDASLAEWLLLPPPRRRSLCQYGRKNRVGASAALRDVTTIFRQSQTRVFPAFVTERTAR